MRAKSKRDFAHSKNNSPDRGVRRTRGGQWRGKGRQAPQEFGIRQSVLNASLPVVNARVRRIEYADAKPPHLHLEFIRLGCSESLLRVSPFMRLGCSECLLWFSPRLRQDFTKTLGEFGNGKTSKLPPGGTQSLLGGSKIELRSPGGLPRATQELPREQISSFFEHF